MPTAAPAPPRTTARSFRSSAARSTSTAARSGRCPPGRAPGSTSAWTCGSSHGAAAWYEIWWAALAELRSRYARLDRGAGRIGGPAPQHLRRAHLGGRVARLSPPPEGRGDEPRLSHGRLPVAGARRRGGRGRRSSRARTGSACRWRRWRAPWTSAPRWWRPATCSSPAARSRTSGRVADAGPRQGRAAAGGRLPRGRPAAGGRAGARRRLLLQRRPQVAARRHGRGLHVRAAGAVAVAGAAGDRLVRAPGPVPVRSRARSSCTTTPAGSRPARRRSCRSTPSSAASTCWRSSAPRSSGGGPLALTEDLIEQARAAGLRPKVAAAARGPHRHRDAAERRSARPTCAGWRRPASWSTAGRATSASLPTSTTSRTTTGPPSSA